MSEFAVVVGERGDLGEIIPSKRSQVPLFELGSSLTVDLSVIRQRLSLRHEWYAREKMLRHAWKRRRYKTKKALSNARARERGSLRALEKEMLFKLRENAQKNLIQEEKF